MLYLQRSGYENNEPPMVVSMFGNQMMVGDNVGATSDALCNIPHIDPSNQEKPEPNDAMHWIGMDAVDEEVFEKAKQQPHFFDFLGLGTA